MTQYLTDDTITEATVAALAEAVAAVGEKAPDGCYEDYGIRPLDIARALLEHLTPEARDLFLLGFAVDELPVETHLFIGDSGSIVWGKSVSIVIGSTPLVAVTAALAGPRKA